MRPLRDRLPRLAAVTVTLLSLSSSAADYRPPRKNLPFPVYTNAPIGRQLTGQHMPASTPALSPEAAQKKFTVPEGYEIRLFASEPEVVNPVAMTWDERGRLWVVELYEYPLGAKPGTAPRDRIKILEDTDGDGRADKVHVWADGLNLATGILLGHGGAYVGQAPHLLFLRDTDGDDRADKTEIVKTGFGLEDRHELLNGFTWGPDGQLYMTHGVFTRSSVTTPGAAPTEPPVLLTAGVARLNQQTGKFEIYAEGTSNPWGVDFDGAGNAYVSACVIEHLFHLVPAGLYDRQAGSPPHPFAYELLHSINDHKHHMAAYAGIQVCQGDQFPAENDATILQGNIHDNAIHQDRLVPNGSSFTASHWRDLVRANDGWFMPVSTQIGPDGAVWIMDWYDRYPCYQNANADPAGVDREHGRIWRVVHTGRDPGRPVPSRPAPAMDLAKLPSADLVKLLAHPNVWQRRMAQRVLNERRDNTVLGRLQDLFAQGTIEGPLPVASVSGKTAAPPTTARLAAFWTLHSSGYLNDDVLVKATTDREPVIRSWAARFIGERQVASGRELELLARLARDPEPTVRLSAAVACRQFTSSHLTVNRPPAKADADITPVLEGLIEASADARDPVIPFMIWHAAEPLVAADPGFALDWLSANGASHLPLSGKLAAKVMRRLCDLGGAASMDRAVAFLERVLPESPALAQAAIDGLIKGQEGKALLPSQPIGPFIARLIGSGNAGITERGQKLGSLWGDAAALKSILAQALDAAAPVDQRLRAIQTVHRTRNEATRSAMLQLLGAEVPEPLQIEALAALADIGGDDVPRLVLQRWKGMSPAARRAAAATLASRRNWALPLLAQVSEGTLSASDFGAPVIRSLMQNKDESVREKAKAAIGRFRESGADKAAQVAAKRKIVLAAEPDIAAGHEVAKKSCLVCHKLHGEGENVGPDLTGVGRSSLEALLWNVIDPNQVIGAGYEQVEIETKDDRVIAGRMIENTENRVRLLLQGGREEVIAKSDVKSQRTLESSVMPEGLDQIPDADFRNLIWYILAPPQEGPLTPAKRETIRKSAGQTNPGSASREPAGPGVDRESVALWNPQWNVVAPDFEGTPRKLPEHLGRSNVLQTHPFPDRTTPAAIERRLELPADRTSTLRFAVAAHDQGDWQLRVRVDGRVLHESTITHEGARWRTVSVDLKDYAGRTVVLRLENAANDWAWEFAYWADLELRTGQLAGR
jgi:putative membrane-bound dehydrogenase-like protein